MVSHSHKFVFIHIPKTGGTSIAHALAPYGIVLRGSQNRSSLYFKHASAVDIERMLGEECASYFKFSVVRNPWDWAVSNYLFNRGLHYPWTRGTSYNVCPDIPAWAGDWPFKRWLAWWLKELQPQQSRMLTDRRGRLFVDHLMRFESINADFSELLTMLKIGHTTLPHKMLRPVHVDYSLYYDRETWEMVAAHFGEDIDRFDYKILKRPPLQG